MTIVHKSVQLFVYMQLTPIQDTISFSQLRTQTKRLSALLSARKTVALLKGSHIVGHIIPNTHQVTQGTNDDPLFMKGFDLGKSKYTFIKRKDFYE